MLGSLFTVALAATTCVAQRSGGRPQGGRTNAASVPSSRGWRGQGQTAGSPTYNSMFQYTLPLGSVAVPSYTTNVNGVPVEYYEITIEAFQAQMYPDLGPANFVGYNGTVPGPTFMIKRGTETVVRFLNKGTVSAAVHLHGSYTHAAWDGWAADEMEVGQWKDYYYPNSENARSIWYHDHADGHTAPDAYYGQSGIYIIYDPEEDALGLPSGKYDVPLAISDKMYQSNGDLADPTGNRMSFWGDIIHVNNQPWPFLATEPRKYRLRVYDMSLSRPYDLYFVAPDGSWLDFVVIGSDSGLFGGPVKTNDLTIAPGERYEIVVDFGKFAGQNITLGNKMAQQQVQEFQNTDKVMLFQVGENVSDSSNNGDVPSVLNPNIQWPEKRTTVDHVFNFQMGGDDMWTINGIDFNNVNNRVLARPPQGTVELWEVRHTGGPAIHPVHIHLVNLQVVSRSGGSRGLLPYETAGLKDVVLLEPGEIVQVLAYYGPWNGLYMFHCHNLIHEDHAMMDVFNVTLLTEMGYDYNSTTSYADPKDTRFIATDYNEDAFSDESVASAVNALANLNAYAPVNSIIAAQEAHYATAGYNGESATGAPSQTAAPESSGYGFATSTTAEFASGFTTMATPVMARPTWGGQVDLTTIPISPDGTDSKPQHDSVNGAGSDNIVTVFDDPENFNVKHQLQNKWTLWFTKPPSGKQDWNELLKEVITFESVEEFWGIYNNITPASELAQKSDYHLFKTGVRPEWEDVQNKHGGRWAYTFKNSKANDEVWLHLMLAAIGETLEDDDDNEVMGVNVNIRKAFWRVGLWTRTAGQSPKGKAAEGADPKESQKRLERLGKAFKEVLQLPAQDMVEFAGHAESAHTGSSRAKAKYSL